MNILDKIGDWFIKRDLKKRHIIPKVIYLDENYHTRRKEFIKVLNTLRENKVMVESREDGIYIRLAGNESNDESFMEDFVKVVCFRDLKLKKILENEL